MSKENLAVESEQHVPVDPRIIDLLNHIDSITVYDEGNEQGWGHILRHGTELPYLTHPTSLKRACDALREGKTYEEIAAMNLPYEKENTVGVNWQSPSNVYWNLFSGIAKLYHHVATQVYKAAYEDTYGKDALLPHMLLEPDVKRGRSRGKSE